MSNLLKRSIPIILPLLVFASFRILLEAPHWFYGVFIFLVFLSILSISHLTGKIKSQEKVNFLIAPLFFILGSLIFFIFIENRIFQYLFMIGAALMLAVQLENIFIYFNHPYKEKISLAIQSGVSNFFDFITLFLFYSSFFSFRIFLNITLLSLIPLVFLITILLVYENFWANGIFRISENVGGTTSESKSVSYILIIGILLAEMFWVVNFLPLSFYTNALLLTIVYYTVTSISKCYFKGETESKVVKRYLVFGLFLIGLVLGTAKWK
ncbi:MAG: hypothetical protein COX43_03490 [Parcubacteria group bacterium CG23_combo_of_CG06-09_8_20_14_all_35_9]|nr:MAG: hypothetical protein COX43_03490 [Parcubacteria group bacterium CG23_combo_of_CG06-09_8_20_14_all_35_9]